MGSLVEEDGPRPRNWQSIIGGGCYFEKSDTRFDLEAGNVENLPLSISSPVASSLVQGDRLGIHPWKCLNHFLHLRTNTRVRTTLIVEAEIDTSTNEVSP